jgi:16S rRNA (cytosine1402-N4)-methyltransferase
MEPRHDSVLLREAIDELRVDPSDTVLDGTIGGAGHFALLLSKLGSGGTLVGIDADPDAVERGRKAAEGASPRVEVVHDNFRNLDRVLDALGIEEVNKVLFDLGWSSFHLSAGKGFSFQKDEPLQMTYGTPEAGKTAADLLNLASEEALADLLFSLGEERFSRGIARAIVEMRPLVTTADLVAAVMKGTPGWYQHRRIHPATKTFQALRIAVNDELGALRDGLGKSLARLSVGGRVAIISFHSLEDRIVKLMLRDAAHEGLGTLVTKKPIAPSLAECARNPRARSAKLRVFEKGAAVRAASEISSFAYAS